MPKSLLALALLALTVPAAAGVFQDRGKKPMPGPGGTAPEWHRIVKLSDGRTFITDGGLSLDVALAKPAVLPAEVLGPASAKVIEGFLTAALPDEFGLSQLGPGRFPRSYAAPSGLVLNADYIDYVRRILPPARTRLRMKGDFEPVVILLDGKPVGLVMPIKR